MQTNKNNAFTLIELIVVITIMAVLGTIAFLSFQGYSSNSRDSVRKTDISSIGTSLEIFDVKSGFFPEPASGSVITYSGGLTAWTQGTFSEAKANQVGIINKTPKDPLVGVEYTYSVTNMGNEYEIGASYEGGIAKNKNLLNKTYADSQINGIARVYGNYNGVILPIKNGNSFYFVAVPTIINGNLTWDTIENILANRSLVTNGGPTLPTSYSGSKFITGKINTSYEPTGPILVFSGNLNELTSSGGAMVEVLSNTQNAYSGTNIGLLDEGIINLLSIAVDTTNPSVEAINAGSNLVGLPLGLKLTKIAGSSSSGTGTSGTGGDTPTYSETIDFETDGEGTLYTTTQGTFTRTTSTKNQGSYSIESGNHSNSSSSCFELTKTFTTPVDITFDYSVSSEASFDFLNYYVDGGLVSQLGSGNVGWSTYTDTISAGTYTFKWCYEKDGSANSGQDKGWIDDVRFVENVPKTCATTPTTGTMPHLGTATVGVPTSVNQAWTYSATPGNCTYDCASGFVGNNCSTDLSVCNSTLTQGEVDELNSLTYQSLSISDWCSSTDLNLNSKSLTTVPTGVYKLLALNNLDMGNNQITSISSDIGNLINLTTLNLYTNQITSIPTQIGSLVNLTYLDIGDNQITTVPSQIGNLVNLTTLYLYTNQITSIPTQIGNLINLNYLDFYGNALTNIPSEIGNLTNLYRLYLGVNQLTTLPSELVNLTHLTDLDLSDNIGLGNLNSYFDSNSYLYEQDGIPANTYTMSIVGNGSNITVSVFQKSCATTPTIGTMPHLGTTTVGNPDIANKPWTYSATPGNCTYNCASGFLGTNCATDLSVCNSTLTQGEADELNTLTSQSLSISDWCSTTTLDLSYKTISTVPTGVYKLAGLSYLDLGGNTISSIGSGIGNLVNLTDLYLYENTLTNLPAQFTSLTNLVVLDLNSNYDLYDLATYFDINSTDLAWEDIPTAGKTMTISGNGTNVVISISDTVLACITMQEANALNLATCTEGCPSPRTKFQWCNETTSITFHNPVPTAILKLTNLSNLRMNSGFQDFTDVPVEIGNLTNLNELSIGQITSLPSEIGNLTNLTSLEVYGDISNLPSEIGNLTNLNSYISTYTQLTNLPESFGNLVNLTTLDLSYNQLSSLPNSFGNLSSLTTFTANNNQLTSLPESFGNLTNLNYLEIGNNLISSLPNSFGDLTSLNNLQLYYNQLTSLPESFGNLTNLVWLTLNNNQLTNLPNLFGNLVNLKGGYYSLDLSYNQLTSLPSSFGNLININGLLLNNNQLTSLPSSIGGLSGIHYIDDNSPGIDLSNNLLTSLPDEIGDITYLNYLGVQNNQLTTLPSGLKNLNYLIALWLSGNTGLGNLNGDFGARWWYPRIDISQTSITPAGETMRIKTYNGIWRLYITTPFCATTPTSGTITHIGTTTNGTPTSENQAWTYSATPGNCSYTCATGWSGTNCNTQVPACGTAPTSGTIPNIGTLSTGTPTSINQTWTYSATPGNCTYSCSGGYRGAYCNIPSSSTDVGCNEQDITVGGYTISACNVGSTIAGTGSTSYGLLFQWGRDTEAENGNWIAPDPTYGDRLHSDAGNTNPSRWSGVNYQGPCDSGYHIPSMAEWNGLISAGGWGFGYPADGIGMVNDLKLPFAGYLSWSDGTPIGRTPGSWGGGNYWTTSTSGASSQKVGVAGSQISSTYDSTGRSEANSIRCFKN